MAMLQSLLFPPPSSIFVTVMTAVSSLSMVNAGINEFKGKSMQYSKMVAANSGPKISRKVGMTLFYFPAFLVGAASFLIFPIYDDARFLLIRFALTLHFLKRLLESLLFPPPPSIFVTVMTAVSSLSMVNAGINEFKGKSMQYSKMVAANSGPKISSKVGMTLFYFPAFLVGAASFVVFPGYDDARFLLIRSALTLHFLKRLLETWFVHKFSGEMTIEAAIIVPFSYFMATLTMIYTQSLSLGLPDPSIDLKYIGSILFLIGTCGNLYHHYLLSTLRKDGEKEYKIPKGGLFDQVICPHYLFEVIAFWGFAFVSQTLYATGLTVGTSLYLLGRSYATRKWYANKFDDFPANVKALIPYIF